jgi:hypothetical protein
MFVFMLVGSVAFWAGCDDDDDDDDAGPVMEAPADSSGDSGAEAEASGFTAITPSGLSSDVFSIAGRGTVLSLSCSAIDGAVSYQFTTSMGQSVSSATPDVGIDLAAAPPAGATFSVYATNGDGENTRTASKGL